MPSEQLEINGALRLNSSNIPNSEYVKYGHDGTDGFIDSYGTTGGGFKINYNSGQAVKILTNSTGGYMEVGHNVYLSTIDGGVGIGTNTVQPGYKLVVDNGKAGFREVYVKLSGPWPDYVFSGNHKLKPLNELQNYFLINQQLPGMPKAMEIETEGQNLGDIQRLQQEKIEESYLYILELNENINLLKNEIVKLKNQLEKINNQRN